MISSTLKISSHDFAFGITQKSHPSKDIVTRILMISSYLTNVAMTLIAFATISLHDFTFSCT